MEVLTWNEILGAKMFVYDIVPYFYLFRYRIWRNTTSSKSPQISVAVTGDVDVVVPKSHA